LTIINRINKLEKPDFVIISGDLTEYGTEAETQYFKACMLKFEVLVFLTPGNHDNYWDVGEKFTDYREYLNPPVLSPGEDTEYCDDYSFDYGDFHFISYNSGDSEGLTLKVEGLTNTQLAWMKADQKEAYDNGNGQKHTIIFTHAPSVPNCAWEGREKYYGFYRDYSHTHNDVAFVNWLNGEDGANSEGLYVEAVFAGHTHQDFIFTQVNSQSINNPDFISGNNAQSIYYHYYLDDNAFHIETSSSCKLYSG